MTAVSGNENITAAKQRGFEDEIVRRMFNIFLTTSRNDDSGYIRKVVQKSVYLSPVETELSH
jgi:hypothetical protein